MSDARQRILARVREAVSGRERSPHPGPLRARDRTAGAPEEGPAANAPSAAGPGTAASPDDAVDRFIEQFRANGGEAVLLPSAEAAREWLESLAGAFDGVATAAGLPADLVPALPSMPPESAPLGISMAIGAAAETGTLLLGSAEGRRSQLLPPVHVVLVRSAAVDRTLGEALSRLRAQAGAGLLAAIGLHSGPSKSADIGRHLVVGVHGPGRVLAVIITNSEES